MKVLMRRVLAFLTFNVYSGCLVSAFQINTAYQFDSEMIRRLHGTGVDSPTQWGWGNHFIWRLLAAVVSTAFAAVLTGAIARTRGVLTAALSNIPSVAIWIAFVGYWAFEKSSFIYGDQTITIHTGMIAISLITIPLTTYVAYVSGEFGATLQRDECGEQTVLGIAGYHWVWMIVPAYLYAAASILPIAQFLSFNFLRDDGLISGFVSMALFVTAIASLSPFAWVYSKWRTPATGVVGSLRSAFVNSGIIGLGLAAVTAVQLANSGLLGKLTLWS